MAKTMYVIGGRIKVGDKVWNCGATILGSIHKNVSPEARPFEIQLTEVLELIPGFGMLLVRSDKKDENNVFYADQVSVGTKEGKRLILEAVRETVAQQVRLESAILGTYWKLLAKVQADIDQTRSDAAKERISGKKLPWLKKT